MREIMISKNDAGQRLDRFLSKNIPGLPSSLAQKYIRLKRVKINGKGAKRDARLQSGDVLRLYINDEFFDKSENQRDSKNLKFLENLKNWRPRLDILMEDENIILLNKPAGLSVHADESEKLNTLIYNIQAYLYQKGEWKPERENAFAPALCNRIDKNTGGIVIAAKNAEALRVIDAKIRAHEIIKSYLCVTVHKPEPSSGEIAGYLYKNPDKKLVKFYTRPIPGAKHALTDYQVLESEFYNQDCLSLVKCRLYTGRTHQIRVSMAHIGCPILGDGKYGIGDINRRFGETRQLLCAYQIRFDFQDDAGILEYLHDQTFTVRQVPFCKKYFPKVIKL